MALTTQSFAKKPIVEKPKTHIFVKDDQGRISLKKIRDKKPEVVEAKEEVKEEKPKAKDFIKKLKKVSKK